LGQGAFGKVYSCIHKETGSERVVKEIQKYRMDYNEFINLRSLDHPNIVKIHEYFEDKDRCYIITEILKGGELFDEITRRNRFSENDAAMIMKHIFQSVNYCHKNHIMHRDLKPENIMLEENKDYS